MFTSTSVPERGWAAGTVVGVEQPLSVAVVLI